VFRTGRLQGAHKETVHVLSLNAAGLDLLCPVNEAGGVYPILLAWEGEGMAERVFYPAGREQSDFAGYVAEELVGMSLIGGEVLELIPQGEALAGQDLDAPGPVQDG
jgi:hypothetical protein